MFLFSILIAIFISPELDCTDTNVIVLLSCSNIAVQFVKLIISTLYCPTEGVLLTGINSVVPLYTITFVFLSVSSISTLFIVQLNTLL